MTNLPCGWTRATLGSLGTWYGGGTPSKRRPDYWHDGTVSWLSPKDMGQIVLSGTRDHIAHHAIAETSVRLVPANSVAVVVRSGILERRVPIALVPFETTLNQDMKAIVPVDGLDPKWLHFALLARERDILHSCRKAGTTVASLDTRKLMDIEVHVPPTAEQHRIVEAIDAHLSRLDSAVHSVRRALRRLENLETSLLSAFVEADPDTGTLPAGWHWRTIGELSAGSGYGTSTKCDYLGNGEPVLRIPNVQKGLIDSSDMKYAVDSKLDLSSYHLRPGDLLFVRTNGSPSLIGLSAVVTEAMNVAFASYLIRFQLPDPDLAQWVQTVVGSPKWRHQIISAAASSAGQYNLNAKFLASIKIPLPPQKQMVEILSRVLTLREDADRLRPTLELALARSASIRTGILKSASSGLLVSQDPEDEPVWQSSSTNKNSPTDRRLILRKVPPNGGQR